MRLHCLIRHHAPLPPSAANQGFQFSSCSRCGSDMVRSGNAWRRVPSQFRVVWRTAGGAPRHARTAASVRHRQLVLKPRHVPFASHLVGLLDLIRSALRVAWWAWRDRWRGFCQSFRLLPRPTPAVLRLPAR